MRRRDFVTAIGLALVSRAPARAQQKAMPVIGFLSPTNDVGLNLFRRGLRELGYVEGQNLQLVLRSSDGDNSRLPALATEIAALRPDVIVTNGEPAIRAAKEVAGAIPIVMSIVGDPVAAGFAESLAHPGGNLTGFTNLAGGLVAKRLELLLEIVPNPGCIAVLRNPGNRALDPIYWQEITAAAQTLGTALKPVAVRGASELETGFAEIARQHCRALLVMPDPLFGGELVALAAQQRIAASYDNRSIVQAGGLMSYGPDLRDMFLRAAGYVDKILKGTNPADLPIEQPTKFELVINLKTAKALGLTVPQSILARADEVIE